MSANSASGQPAVAKLAWREVRPAPDQLTNGTASAAPICFLHGAYGAAVAWHHQLTEFGRTRRAIAVDLPAHGASSHIRWTTLDEAADRVAATLRAAEVSADTTGPIHIVGFSLGGDVALRLLARHPELVRTLVVTGASTLSVSRAELALDTLTWPLVANRYAHRIASRSMGLSPAERATHLESSAPLQLRDIGRLSRQVLLGAPIADLRSTSTPVLALAGARESRHARRSAVHLACSLPAGVAAEVPGVGHTWNVRFAGKFNRVLGEWLANPGVVPDSLDGKRSAPSETHLPTPSRNI